MAKEIFHQDRPRSAMARRLDEAFAGCEQWTLAPPSQRRSEAVFSPRLVQLLEDDRQGGHRACPGARGAVVIGVMEENDVAVAGAVGRVPRDRPCCGVAASSPAPSVTRAPAASPAAGSPSGSPR